MPFWSVTSGYSFICDKSPKNVTAETQALYTFGVDSLFYTIYQLHSYMVWQFILMEQEDSRYSVA
ncbi:hypothetical protein [Floridanema fluviatile]|uniref:hypothetical protein n=1 Tax=Floridanema fluviatile TaxID=3396171 RepID=UPI0039A4F54F